VRGRSLWSAVALAVASLAGWYAVATGGTGANAADPPRGAFGFDLRRPKDQAPLESPPPGAFGFDLRRPKDQAPLESPPPGTVPQAPVVPGRMPPLDVRLPASEASGLIASRAYPGMYYWLRDGGSSKPGKPRDAIWGMRLSTGGLPEPVRGDELFPSYPVTGAKNQDWEALTVDDAGALWIGQIGANNCRDRQRLLRVAEPDPGGPGPLEVVAAYDLRFPDNPKPGCRTYNSEALIWLDGHFYVFAKTRGTPVYRVDLPAGTSGKARLTRIGRFGGDVDNISSASVSDDRSRLMVQDHERLWVFTTDPARTGDDFMADAISRDPTGTARFEAPGGASVEGGTFVRGSHDIAFVAEDRHIYYARAPTYGEPAVE
jgi:hypothetical protein